MTTRNGDMPAMPVQATNKLIEMISTCESDSALDSYISTFGGLTKREQFAMAAMQGLLADPNNSDTGMDRIANYAIEAADALLAKLDKDGGE